MSTQLMGTRQSDQQAPVDGHTLDEARLGDEAAFRALVEPHRRELHAHCYRMLGSIADAEDLVQETLLAAWRGIGQFEGRATVRAWLFRIATNRCLNALRAASRRPHEQSTGLVVPEQTRRFEPSWLEPYPDALLDEIPDTAPGPHARYEKLESIKLAFIIALQQLPPRQRAVLILRDVLGYRAAEVADMLETSEAAVNSALKRARATLADRTSEEGREPAPATDSAREQELAGHFAAALERGDIAMLLTLLTDDAQLSMPPDPIVYEGAEVVADFIRERCPGRLRLIATRANSQPAFACYVRDPQAPISHAYGLLVLSLHGDRITAITRFTDSGVLASFGLPRTLPE
ncbi:sigma-70 family RNA polymerase sigma factor [Kribbella sp. VKM Ac-2566]|uniref:sigma-70 family RNA polymerase sigma factor n=1 Tax=Kribbella sp. VKM Ac-2566 TaxID=2512218 RepID=UPI001EDCBE44|nr:sigma-70 family RNA polymerase sigma factor [Kribbella sp. VKM Ac-2566]